LQIYTVRPLMSVRTVDETLVTEPIPMDVEIHLNPTLPEGQRTIIQEGQDGERQIAHRIIRIDGVEVEREVLEYEIIREPVTHIVQDGSGAAVIERR